MNVYHKCCFNCKNILTLAEMEGDGFCNSCKKHAADFYKKFVSNKEETNDTVPSS